MKKLLLIAICIFCTFLCYGQVNTPAIKPQQIIIYSGYTSYWNPNTLIPDSVVYVAHNHAKAAVRAPSFHPTGDRINENKDYKGSGYDQGHLCNASDENGNSVDELNSFDQCNIYPQRPNCNRLTWLALENHVRQLAANYASVRVKVYWHLIEGYMGPDKVTIPLYCDKEIWYSGHHEKYSMPNVDTVNKHLYTYYRVN